MAQLGTASLGAPQSKLGGSGDPGNRRASAQLHEMPGGGLPAPGSPSGTPCTVPVWPDAGQGWFRVPVSRGCMGRAHVSISITGRMRRLRGDHPPNIAAGQAGGRQRPSQGRRAWTPGWGQRTRAERTKPRNSGEICRPTIPQPHELSRNLTPPSGPGGRLGGAGVSPVTASPCTSSRFRGLCCRKAVSQ